MATTAAGGIPYPSSGEATRPPISIQEMADHLDKHLPMFVRPATSYHHNIALLPAPDPAMYVDLREGAYRVRCTTSYSAPMLGRDVEQCWQAADFGVMLMSRFVTGPEVNMTDTNATRYIHRPIADWATVAQYGVHNTRANQIIEELMITVSASVARVTLKWRELSAAVEGDPADPVTRTAESFIRIQRIARASLPS